MRVAPGCPKESLKEQGLPLAKLRPRQLCYLLPEALGVDIAVPVSIDAGPDLCGWHVTDFCERLDHEPYELGSELTKAKVSCFFAPSQL